jgi:hypothetical protein
VDIQLEGEKIIDYLQIFEGMICRRNKLRLRGIENRTRLRRKRF